MISKRLYAVALILIIVVSGFAIPKHTAKADDTEQATKFTIKMNEYNFVVDGQKAGDPINLKVNQLYDMTLENDGKLTHEIWWGQDAQMDKDEGRLDGYSTNLLENVPVAIFGVNAAGQDPYEIDTPGLKEIALNPGQTLTVEFTLPDTAKGNWEIGCFQPIPKATPEAAATAAATAAADSPDVPHYMAGMKAKIIVQ